jgi:hypothetical protein
MTNPTTVQEFAALQKSLSDALVSKIDTRRETLLGPIQECIRKYEAELKVAEELLERENKEDSALKGKLAVIEDNRRLNRAFYRAITNATPIILLSLEPLKTDKAAYDVQRFGFEKDDIYVSTFASKSCENPRWAKGVWEFDDPLKFDNGELFPLERTTPMWSNNNDLYGSYALVDNDIAVIANKWIVLDIESDKYPSKGDGYEGNGNWSDNPPSSNDGINWKHQFNIPMNQYTYEGGEENKEKFIVVIQQEFDELMNKMKAIRDELDEPPAKKQRTV